ncbi:hypothetical protein [Sorangium sp. So ce131]|uniref:hypothetical protein n=1 Tax=Sorangium sp. So ce131 TaxID=3133282 RepID=UPI003F5EEC1D
MKSAFPFNDLLGELREAGIPVGTREHLAFARLLERYDGTSRDEFRAAVTCLLARSEAEVEIVHATFERLYPGSPGPSAPTSLPDARPQLPVRAAGRRRRALTALLAGALLAMLLGAVGKYLLYRTPDTARSGVSNRIREIDARMRVVPPAPDDTLFRRPANWPPPQEATLARWPLPAALLVIGTGVTMLGAGLTRGRRRLIARARRAQRERFGNLPAPRHYQLAWKSDAIARSALDDMIGLLDTAVRASDERLEIDVDRTVDQVARTGLVPTLVYRPRSGRRRAVVLQDTGAPCRPFRGKTAAFVARLVRRGVEVDQLYFDRDPSKVSTRPGGAIVPLASLAPRLRGLPLIVIGTGEGFAAAARDPQARLRRELGPWPVRVLLNPLEAPDLWPAGLAGPAAPIGAWPMSPRGVLAAARELSELRHHRRAPAQLSQIARPPITVPDVLRLRAMLALGPSPSFQLAEALRRRFLPNTPEEIVLAVEPLVDGAADGSEREEIDAAIQLFRAEDPERRKEAEVRRFLIEVLAQSRPEREGSAAFLRLRLDIALQRLHLAEDEAEQARVKAELLELGRASLGPELLDRLLDALALEHRLGGPGVAQRTAPLRSLISALGSVSAALAALGPGYPSRVALGGRMLGRVLAVAATAAAVLAASGAFAARPLSLDGRTHILWSRDDLRRALYAADGFIDVYVAPEKVYILAAKSDDPPSPDVRARGDTLMLYLVDTSWPLPVVRAKEIGPAADVMREQNLLLERLSGGAMALMIDASYQDSGSAVVDVGVIDDDSLTLRSGFDVGEVKSFPPPDERAYRVANHSKGILPGRAHDVAERLVHLIFAQQIPTNDCLPPRLWCGDACVDPLSDAANCGLCNYACKQGPCVDGKCGVEEPEPCPPGETACGGRCVNTATDRAHCGRCDNLCKDGPCVDGTCTLDSPCPTGKTLCGGDCLDLTSNVSHCGRCWHRCEDGRCVQGQCVDKSSKVRECNALIETINKGVSTISASQTTDAGGSASLRSMADAMNQVAADTTALRLSHPELKNFVAEYRNMARAVAKASRDLADAADANDVDRTNAAQAEIEKSIKAEDPLVDAINKFCQSP